jgi:adenylosuccinate lyase
VIARYSTPEMTANWSQERRFALMLEVEILACEAMERRGQVPGGTAAAVRERARFDNARIDELERTLKHDVIAFLTNVAEHAGEPARHLHKGMTSSDVLDTALALQLRDAGVLLRAELAELIAALGRRAREHAETVCIGRSHGVHAEPTSCGGGSRAWTTPSRTSASGS